MSKFIWNEQGEENTRLYNTSEEARKAARNNDVSQEDVIIYEVVNEISYKYILPEKVEKKL